MFEICLTLQSPKSFSALIIIVQFKGGCSAKKLDVYIMCIQCDINVGFDNKCNILQYEIKKRLTGYMILCTSQCMCLFVCLSIRNWF